MQKFFIYFNKCLAALFLFSNYSFATNLPDELLYAPIHLISGDEVNLAKYKGKKPVYLKFWATWCQPCQQQMTHFEHIQNKFGNDIEVIGINLGLNDDLPSVKKTINEFGLTMPMAIDKTGNLAQKFRLVGTPYHLLFDKNMNLVHRGHEADESLNNKLSLMAQKKSSKMIDSKVLAESESDIVVNTNDGKTHAIFFTATWCDWYLKDSRPTESKNCIAAQYRINHLYKEYPKISWLGVASRLWTAEKDLLDYKKKYDIKHPIKIDKSNRLFNKYTINDLPVLILVKGDDVVGKINTFDDADKLNALLKSVGQ